MSTITLWRLNKITRSHRIGTWQEWDELFRHRESHDSIVSLRLYQKLKFLANLTDTLKASNSQNKMTIIDLSKKLLHYLNKEYKLISTKTRLENVKDKLTKQSLSMEMSAGVRRALDAQEGSYESIFESISYWIYSLLAGCYKYTKLYANYFIKSRL